MFPLLQFIDKVGRSCEAICEEIVLQVLNCFLQGDDVPFSSNVPFDTSFLSTSRSRVPLMNTEPRLFSQSVGCVFVEVILLA